MALPYPTFINFKWYKTLWPELSLALVVQSPHLSSFPTIISDNAAAARDQQRKPSCRRRRTILPSQERARTHASACAFLGPRAFLRG